jgi:hypothetical protein
MSSVVISGDTSGAITLSAPAVSGTNTATLPAATGTVMVSGNQPTFFAYKSSNQTSTAGTDVKIVFDTEIFDTNNNFASNRFTPTVAGYYQLNANVFYTNSVTGYALLSFWKNGGDFVRGPQMQLTTAAYNAQGISNIIYFNGSTDYVEVYSQTAQTSTLYGVVGTPYLTSFSGCLIRTA